VPQQAQQVPQPVAARRVDERALDGQRSQVGHAVQRLRELCSPCRAERTMVCAVRVAEGAGNVWSTVSCSSAVDGRRGQQQAPARTHARAQPTHQLGSTHSRRG
jgi:hypothetical protein